MRTILRSTVIVAIVAMAFVPLAEAGKRKGKGKGKGLGAAPGNSQAACNERRAAIGNAQGRLDDRAAQLAGVNAEINNLNRRMRELQDAKRFLEGRVSQVSTRLPQRRKKWKESCGQQQTCEQFERLVDALETRQKPQEKLLDEVRKEINDSRKRIGDIQKKIQSIKTEWDQLSCNALQPGVTPLNTVNRCNALYRDWDGLQRELNVINSRLPMLASRYRSVASSLAASEKQATAYETYLDKNCQKSPKLKLVRRYKSVKENALKLQAELDTLVRAVVSVRGIKISFN